MEFEKRLRSDDDTRLEQSLEELPPELRPRAFEQLLTIEIGFRSERQEHVKSVDLTRRFPEFANIVDRVLCVDLPTVDGDWAGESGTEQLPDDASPTERTISWDAEIPSSATVASAPRMFADYEILSEIARGGMGVVYKARQTKLNRVVALKMILSGQLASRRDVERFHIEAEAAAKLEHPGIVPIHEIGEHDGQHFFSMGFIDGESLADRLKRGKLAPKEAAALTKQVAEAIAFAHKNAVIHRDLKPANVLIDADGQAKVTDFGLAKQTDDLGDGQTGTGDILGTPAYMPPEQATGDTKRIGTGADVYSLGAVLYALVTGRPPFQETSLLGTLRAVAEKEPSAPHELNSAIDADLETICLKCLEKDVDRRYESAQHLVDELGRYLNGEPIAARPLGNVSRMWRWCRRKPAAASLIAMAVLLLLTLGIGGPLVALQQIEFANEQARLTTEADSQRTKAVEERAAAVEAREAADEQRAAAEEARAKAAASLEVATRQTETAEAVSGFLGGLFEDADPIAMTTRAFGAQQRGEDPLTAVEVVDRGAAKLKDALQDKPRVRASLLDRIGNVYISLGEVEKAAPLIEEALRLRQTQPEPDELEVAASLQSLGMLRMNQTEFQAAGEVLEQALALRQKHLGDGHALVAETLFDLGTQRLFLDKVADAEKYLQKCLMIRKECFPRESREVAAAMLLVSQVYIMKNESLSAVPLLTEAAAIADKLGGGSNNFSAIVTLFIQGRIADKFGQKERARDLFAEADAKGVALLGKDHHILAMSRVMFSTFLIGIQEPEQAADLLNRVIPVYRRFFGPESNAVATAQLQLARAEREMGNVKEAESLATGCLRIWRNLGSSARPDKVAECLHVLGALVRNRGDLVESDQMLREALIILLHPDRNHHWRRRHVAASLATLVLRRKEIPISRVFRRAGEKLGDPNQLHLKLAETWAVAGQALTQISDNPLRKNDEIIIEHFQAQAVLALKSALSAGVEMDAVGMNPALVPLRARDDFQQLVKEQ